ncbi:MULTISPECIES: hypothetical protein [unclassified Crossiella]|uniref:hypothetical protein n=1 Tax=unclassified Crossiella TaxID=2620835 RepID=UPI001FFF5D64|nr:MULTISPECIES: hypothetical protein [unclassified Crossiella]MCK2239808.1 hypothetical protein [Crossiella sp. S99.2]MCK2252503.1 hypothetical protein [Crossiella sp. S99.1]
MQPTITAQQAAERVEEHVRQALTQLPPETRTERISLKSNSPCDVPSDNGPPGRVQVSNSYQLHGLDPAQFTRYFDTLKNYWTGNNHTVLNDDRPKDWFLWVQHNGDAFRITLQGNHLGELYLGATSPCIWPDGQPK